MRQKKNITKKIWFADELWDVKEAIVPTKDKSKKNNEDQLFLHLIRQMDNKEFDMVIIDANNCVFYPDTEKVRKKIKRLKKLKEDRRILRDKLSSEWLKCVN